MDMRTTKSSSARNRQWQLRGTCFGTAAGLLDLASRCLPAEDARPGVRRTQLLLQAFLIGEPLLATEDGGYDPIYGAASWER